MLNIVAATEIGGTGHAPWAQPPKGSRAKGSNVKSDNLFLKKCLFSEKIPTLQKISGHSHKKSFVLRPLRCCRLHKTLFYVL